MLGRIVQLSIIFASTLCLTLLIGAPVSAQIYVDTAATGANDGSSWTDAFTDLQDALAVATSGDDIWVAAGTYKPTQTNDRLATFQLKNGVGLYGGFAGTESLYDERDLMANTTTLSGEIGTFLVLDNSYHVVTASGTDATAVIDGLTISDGNTPAGAFGYNGAGLFVYLGSPTVSNVTIADNEAFDTGGGMYVEGGAPVLTNVVFRGNAAASGGGMANTSNSDPILTNVTFYGNTADAGGVMANTLGSDPILTNVLAWGNTTTTGPHIANSGGNAIISHSLIESVNPFFLDAPGGDLRVAFGSPAIDVGDNAAPSIPATDLVGTPRISGGVVDVGAYEMPVCPVPIIYVDKTAIGTGDGVSWADAYNELRDVSIPAYCMHVEIWVAAGT